MNPARQENIQQENCLDVKEIDCEFLPLIHDILKRVEKDPSDASSKNKESIEVGNKIQELNRKLEKAKEQVRVLRGIDLNPEEQKLQLTALKNQLALKKELIQKYKSFATVTNFLEAQKTGSGGGVAGITVNGGSGAGSGASLNGSGNATTAQAADSEN
eukprot:TRINITY_DN12221_c0_g1_i1.p1 TRINITY_DN12221_c0_g1~~TRINITY_DN12221_c0_g1_i1.p1  ORF type:complete len:159 (-),score=46.77 TRINITY_DN12221_c0_g1_i1:165-641(-)